MVETSLLAPFSALGCFSALDERLVDPPEAKGFAAGLLDFDDSAAESHRARGNWEVPGQAVYEALDYRLVIAAEAGVIGTAHSNVTNKCGSARENAFVGCLHVGMGTEDGRDLPVQEPAHCDFFAGRFGMHVHDDDGCFLPQTFDFGHSGVEGIVEKGLHEGTALEIEDTHLALGGFQNEAPLPRRAVGIVDRTQQTRLCGNVGGGFPLIPNVIARGDDRHTAAKEVNGNLSGDSATARCILAIYDDEIYSALLEKYGNGSHDSVASGLADDVAQK